jgi:hypothetical protein
MIACDGSAAADLFNSEPPLRLSYSPLRALLNLAR